MIRTTILLPDDLKALAERRARERGTSLGGLIREALEAALSGPDDDDPLFADDEVFDGDAPRDLASAHDHYLYGDGT
ncbi:MAG: CopG family transcriptional regulator [Polyangiales bacterium]